VDNSQQATREYNRAAHVHGDDSQGTDTSGRAERRLPQSRSGDYLARLIRAGRLVHYQDVRANGNGLVYLFHVAIL
jgi:hypothetical protein